MLREGIRFLARDSAIYGISGAVSRLFAFFTLPVLTNALAQSEYGILDATLAFSTILNVFLVFGQDSAIARFFYEKNSDEIYRVKVTSAGFFVQMVMLLFIFTSFYLLTPWIGKVFYKTNPEYIRYWKLSLLAVPGQCLMLYASNIFKWTFKRGRFLFITLGSALVNFLLILYLVLYLQMGIEGAIWPGIISGSLFAVFGIFMNRRYIQFKHFFRENDVMKKMIAYGAPIAFAGVFNGLLPALDRYFLLQNVPLSELGLYAVGIRIASMLGLFIMAFSIAFGPYAFSVWHRPEAKEHFSVLFRYLMFILILLSLTIITFSDYLIRVLSNSSYLEAIVLIPFLLLNQALYGLFEFTSLGITYSKKTYFHLLLLIANFLILAIFLFFLIPWLGILGASLSLFLAHLVKNLLAYQIYRKYYHIRIKIRDGLLMLIPFALLTALIFLRFYFNYSFLSVAIYLVFLASLVYLFNILTQKEKEAILNRLRSFLIYGKNA